MLTAGLITNRRKLTFSVWSPESEWKDYIFIQLCVGRACKTSPCLLKKRQKSWVWTDFQVQVWRPVIGLPQTALMKPLPGLHRGTATNLQGDSLVILIHHVLRSIYLIYFPAKRLVDTFTHETNYDRIKALPAPFHKLNYWDSGWILKNLFLSHSGRKMNYTCREPWVPWFPYVATSAGSYIFQGTGWPCVTEIRKWEWELPLGL